MRHFKVGVYAICKNEEKFAEAWMNSMSEADIIVVTDTGSTDKTVEILETKGAVVYKEEIIPWRFDVARNISLEHLPENVDICVCTDLDEMLVPGWRETLESTWQKGIHQGKYLYNWNLNPDGTPNSQFTYFKVHDRQHFRWVYPVHEVLEYVGKEPYREVFIEGMVLNHYPDSTKSRDSYLELLEMAIEESPEDDRMTYYLGREYMYKEKSQQCIDTLIRYLQLKSAVWKEERCAAMRWIATSYGNLGEGKEAEAWYYRAIAEVPYMREAYVEMAQYAYLKEEWITVFMMANEALKIKEKSKCYINMGYAWNETPYDLAALGAYYLGMYDKALIYAKEANIINPNNQRIKNNLKLIQDKCLELAQKKVTKTQAKEELVHTLLLLFRNEHLSEDQELAMTCLFSLEEAKYKTVIIYNQGYLSNQELEKFLEKFKLNFIIIGEGKNVGIPVGRQRCFEYIWTHRRETKYISELHLDMIFSPLWEEALVGYLRTHEEPMISCGIIDKSGDMKFSGNTIREIPRDGTEMQKFLRNLTSNKIVHGFTHPCIHVSHILEEVGGYDLRFLEGKHCFEDDSLLLGYYYYYGTKAKWYPKVNYQSVVYHAIAMQRLEVADDITVNFNGLVKQYGAMGLKYLSELHKSSWQVDFFQEQFLNQ